MELRTPPDESVLSWLGQWRVSPRAQLPARVERALLDLRRESEILIGWCKERESRGLPAPGVGIGVDAGTVTCGVIGDEGRLEYAIIGDPVNRAAKLQDQTKAEGVLGLASLACRERAIELGYVPGGPHQLLAHRTVAGVSGLVSLIVLGESRRHSPRDA